MRRLILLGLAAALIEAQPPATPLFLRGYSVIPSPQKVTFTGAVDLSFAGGWMIDAPGLAPNHVAFRALGSIVRGERNTLHLGIKPNTLPNGPEAYRLAIAPRTVEITGNSDAGLFYGVQTFLQLLGSGSSLPAAMIEDWPARPLRFLHWDTKHHQDRIETLKRFLDESARLKINRIGFELEDKFEYPTLPAVAAPGAFTTAQLQEIVDYARERFIQVVPIVQAPAHMAYVLKHPRYAHLKADGNNYQSELCNEETFKLIFKMYDDVIAATRGVDSFFVSTDEVYYAGIGGACPEPYNPENRSRHWARFAQRARDHLASRNRKMFAWIEYPLLPQHVPLIPSDIIDGVMGEEEYAPYEKQKQMRQLSYTWIQGDELLFPNYFRLDEFGVPAGNLERVSERIASGEVTRLHPIGVFGAAWDDSGLHNETFWLGWSAVANWAWQPAGVSVEQHTAEFSRLWYGPEVSGVASIYRGLQRQARAWQRSWDRVESRTRAPGYGNSDGKGIGTRRYDYTLTPPAAPALPDLRYEAAYQKRYAGWIRRADSLLEENARLRDQIAETLARASRNRENLAILLAHARFIDHHWRLILALADLEKTLERASAAARASKPADAVGEMLAARRTADRVLASFRKSYVEIKDAFELTRYPKGRALDGKAFVHVLDDTKDHFADRRADLSYLIAPEESLGLVKWRAQLSETLERYAKSHGVPVKALEEKEEE